MRPARGQSVAIPAAPRCLHNLPVQLTTFIGREREIGEVKRLLGTTRLLTLTGSGGCGKSRLALRVAADVLDDYPDGIWLAELASIADPAFVPKMIALALDVPEQPGRDVIETLVDALRPKNLLLVLDNCEHLLTACGNLAMAVLGACHQVRILATSREGLTVPGETLWRVPSLSLPDVCQIPSPEDLVLYDAVRLFVERATASSPGFAVTSENASAVAQVCHRLDGIPLAIELAAARLKVLTVEQIEARLDDRFRLLTGGSRMAMPRHQTLRAAIDWSYHLLSATERVLLRRLAVFAGGWTLEAAESICVGGGLEASNILDALTSLVGKSLVLVETQGSEARYRLLETVRQYSADRLEESGESSDLRRRHLAWYLEVAERANARLRGPEQEAWLVRLETEYDNIGAALAWGKADAQSTKAWLRLAGALIYFWNAGEHWTEGRRWTEHALTRSSEAEPATLQRIVHGATSLAYRQGDYERAGQRAEQWLALARTMKDTEGISWALSLLGNVILERDPVQSIPRFEEALALARDLGDKWFIGFTLMQLAGALRALGNYARATPLYSESIDLSRQVGDKWRTAAALCSMGTMLLLQRKYGRAAAAFAESLPLAPRNRWISFRCLEGLGCVASAGRHHVRAATLFGAAEFVRGSLRTPRYRDTQSEIATHLNHTRTALGDAAFQAAWTVGQGMPLQQAVEYALMPGGLKEPTGQQPRAKRPDGVALTAREHEIVRLVARGLTNREIAVMLVLSSRTADAHVQNILNKLGFNSRAQIAAWAGELGLSSDRKAETAGPGPRAPVARETT